MCVLMNESCRAAVLIHFTVNKAISTSKSAAGFDIPVLIETAL